MIELLVASLIAVEPAPCNLPGEPANYDERHGLECGWVMAPRSDSDPRTIRLWTARVRATRPQGDREPILYINGGPGIATIDSLLPALQEWPALTALRRDRDVIFFDQRGTGRSEESLCPELGEALRAIEAAGLAPEVEDQRSRTAYVNCRAASEEEGRNLDAYTTMATVADVEAIRRAYGADRLNLIGVSYGALVAMQFMRSHRSATRSVVLQSPYPPNSLSWAEQASAASAGFQAIDRACARQADCAAQFGSLLPKLESTVARIDAEPLRGQEQVVDGQQFARALWNLAIRSSTVRYVPEVIHRAHAGDHRLIQALVSRLGGSDSFGGYSHAQAQAINCHESGRTREWYARARLVHPALTPGRPDDGWDRLCAQFRPGFADPGFFAPVASDIPTLIYAGSLDPATPLTDAYQAMRFLVNVTLVEVEGASHAPMAIDDCTLGITLNFIARPETGPDLGCMSERSATRFAAAGVNEVLGLNGE